MEVENLNPHKGESSRVTVTADDLKELNKDGNGQPEAAGDPAVPAQGDTQGDPAGDKPQRPEWVPEEFWNAETGTADYEGLAKALHEKQAKEAPKEGDEPAEETKADTGDVQALHERATAELEKDGKLSDDTYAAYEKIGVSREQVDTYVAGMNAIVQLAQLKAYNEVGGEEQYAAMIEWARTALTEAEIRAYDAAVNSLDEATMLNAVRGLAARFRTESGTEGNLVNTARGRSAGAGDLFESKAQLVEAMRDPRYAKDSGYRAEVQDKLRRSILAGKNLGI